MNTLVFSDVHVNVAEDGRVGRERFVRFLRGIDPTRIRRIVILGDLFDFWFEYRHVIFSGYFEVLRPLADLRDAGVELHFVVGNHDFWTGRFLREELGIQIHERLLLPFGEKRALFIHGDGIRANDYGYRIYRRIARLPLVVGLFRLIHPDCAMWIAQGVSRGSRRLFGLEDPSQGREVQPLEAFAHEALERGEADVVFCGHSHFPVLKELATSRGTGLYINSGDWVVHCSYIEWDGREFFLRYHTEE